jgi:hypothetical protein
MDDTTLSKMDYYVEGVQGKLRRRSRSEGGRLPEDR